jgi:hypothetical protein
VLAGRWWVARDGRRPPGWLLPAGVGLGSTVLTLYRPGITPDHPWADRRLVPVVLPAFVLAAVAAAAWVARRVASRHRFAAPAVAVAAALALAVPAGIGTAALAGSGLAGTEGGELAAVRQVCDALGPDDVVVALDPRGANEWPQVLRGMCGVPAASVSITGAGSEADAARLSVDPARRIAARIAAAGHRPVLLAAEDQGLETLRQLGLTPVPAVRADTTEDQRWLTRRPDGVAPLDGDVWLAPAG